MREEIDGSKVAPPGINPSVHDIVAEPQFSTDLPDYSQLSRKEEVRLITDSQAGLAARDSLRAELGLSAVRNFFGHETEAVSDIDEKLEIIKNGKAAKEQLILSAIPLVMSEVRKNVNKGVPKVDVIQNGIIGLITAIDTFDVSRNTQLSTHAIPKIRSSIARGFHTQVEYLGISEKDFLTAKRVRATYDRLHVQYGRPPTMSELAGETYMSEDDARQYLRDRTATSLHYKGEEGQAKIDTIYETTSESVEDAAIRNADQYLKLDESIKLEFYRLAKLTKTQIAVVELRMKPVPVTFREIGKRFGFNHQYANRQYNDALEKLRQACLQRREAIDKVHSLLA